MRLTKHLLDLFFDSELGASLVHGFDGLLASSGRRPTTESESEEDLGLSPAAQARLAIEIEDPKSVEAVRRALLESRAKVPGSSDEARVMYLDLLSRGVAVTLADFDAWVEAEQWFRDELIAAQEVEADDDDDEQASKDELEADDDDDDDELDPKQVLFSLGGETDDGARLWAANIDAISWALHVFAPEAFAPYAFVHRFHQFESICDELGIPLPRLPGKPSYAERARYYLEINDALQEFRKLHELTPARFDAFLYGFCTEQVPVDDVPEPPEAERAWFLMADPDTDFEMLDASDLASREHWQGHYDMRPGDVGVMWCRSPRSCVHSLWRATSRGFADPFSYYYRIVWIGHSVHVPPISFRELASDPIWAEKPATKAHFQNSSGREVSPAEYEALLRLIQEKGGDPAALPKLRKHEQQLPEDVANERDVEEKLLELVLQRLGFTSKDWTRQYPLRMGRGERVYPDYVFGAKGKRGEEAARMLAEAKYRITSNADLREAYLQARSYAERLTCGAFLLCSLEGVWLFERGERGFDAERYTFFSWEDLSAPARFRDLEALIGKGSNVWKDSRRTA